MKIYSARTISFVVGSVLVVLAVAPFVYATVAPASLTIDSINGQPPSGHCIAGTLTIVGHGTRGGNGGPYSIDVGNGQGATTTVDIGSGAGGVFNFTAVFTPIGSSPTLLINLYHASPTGQDSHVFSVNQCIAPPTQGVVTIVKDVVNDGGGSASPSSFTLHIGNNTFSGSASGADNLLNPDTYTVSEDSHANYVMSGIVCAGNNATTTDGTVAVIAGANYVCTVTNTFSPAATATLHIVKHVVNDNGGTATAADWTMDITATNPSNNNFAGSEQGIDVVVDPGSYSVDESGGSAGYTKTLGTDCSGTIAAGDTKTCVITNDDNAPSLKLVKAVTNDNGGTATAADWTLSATGDGGFSDSGDSTIFHNVRANTSYGLSESTLYGYVGGDWQCDGGTLNGSSITLGLGENVTCTIGNDDIAPTLVVTKIVINNDGGTKTVSDFTLKIGSTEVTSGAENTLTAGTYTVSETNPGAGYVGTIGGDCAEDGSVTLNVGNHKTCTITNDDVAPGLTLIKQVTNDDGGTASTGDFQAYINGEPAPWGQTQTLEAGTYSLSEGSFAGYQASNWSCDGGSLDGSDVTIAPGDTVICTITNDDIAPTLKLVKNVTNDNGGTATPGDWTFIASGPNGFGDHGDSTTFHTVRANESYYLLESEATGYAPGTWSCDGGNLDGNVLTLGLDEHVTCSITNDDIAPSLTLVKEVVGEREISPTAWTLMATGDQDPPVILEGTTPVTSGVAFKAGTYALSESGPDHFAASTWSCVKNDGDPIDSNTVTLLVGDTAVCTITNTFTPYSSDLSLIKSVDDATPDANQTIMYTLTVSNAGPDDATGVVVNDTLPAGVTYVSDDGGGSYASTTGQWDVGTIENGSSTSLHITVTVNADTVGETISNSASVESAVADGNADNNTGSVSITVNTPPPTPTPTPPPPPLSGGGGGGGCILGTAWSPSENRCVPTGQVLGASTSTEGRVLGVSCGLYMDQHLRRGSSKNDPGQVTKLQEFLNKYHFGNFAPTGFFGPLTEAAVKAFQQQYASAILAPWSLSAPTGLAYLTTIRQLNLIECPDLVIPVPTLIPWSENPKAQ